MTYNEYVMERRDIGRITKLNTLTDIKTFWGDVKKMTKRLTSDHALSRWQVLAEIRYEELKKNSRARHEIIEEIQDRVQHNKIATIEELDLECKKHGLDSFDDVLGNMAWNCCDRCGDLWESDQLYWQDYDWGYENEDLTRGIAQEKVEYCALCDKCIKELKKKGANNETLLS